MTRKRKSLPGAKPKGIKQICADRANDRAREKYTDPANNPKAFDLENYKRSIRRALVDVAVLIHDWPGSLRLSYYVDRNGRLRCQIERGTVK